jgi:PAS domain S-box-containing protein
LTAINDITDLIRKEEEAREQQELFLSMTQQSLFGIGMIRDNHFYFANLKFCEILGVNEIEIKQFRMKDFFPMIHPADLPQFLNYYEAQRIELNNRPNHLLFRLTTKNGTNKWIMNTTNIITRKKSTIIQIILIDVTNQKHAEEQRDWEQARSQKLESLGLLAGGIAHDFNNLLMAILGNLQLLLLDQNLNAESQQIIKEIETSSMNAAQITRQLLTFSKGGAPAMEPEDIKVIIENAVLLVLRGSKCICSTDFESNLPLINLDRIQILQVINNLILNAEQAMPNGGKIQISVHTETHHELSEPYSLKPGDYLRINIQDEGRGIPLELQSKLFTPYFTTKDIGHGLGLATSYSIINRHNGILTFKSELNKGTTFIIYLPITATGLKETTPKFLTRNKFQGHILLLEDDLVVQRTLSKLLIHLGVSVEIFSDGNQVLERYKNLMSIKQPVDLIILDLTIPNGMGGKETLIKLKTINPAVKAIVSSGYSNDPIIAEYEQYGFVGALQKPYQLNTLKDLLNLLL